MQITKPNVSFVVSLVFVASVVPCMVLTRSQACGLSVGALVFDDFHVGQLDASGGNFGKPSLGRGS